MGDAEGVERLEGGISLEENSNVDDTYANSTASAPLMSGTKVPPVHDEVKGEGQDTNDSRRVKRKQMGFLHLGKPINKQAINGSLPKYSKLFSNRREGE